MGGCFSVREGNQFNPKWIEEEREYRSVPFAYGT